MDISNIKDAYELHTSSKDPVYRQFCENIISDMLMGKYDKNGKLRELSPKVKDVIHDFYSLSQKFKKKYKTTGSTFKVFRGRKFYWKNCRQ